MSWDGRVDTAPFGYGLIVRYGTSRLRRWLVRGIPILVIVGMVLLARAPIPIMVVALLLPIYLAYLLRDCEATINVKRKVAMFYGGGKRIRFEHLGFLVHQEQEGTHVLLMLDQRGNSGYVVWRSQDAEEAKEVRALMEEYCGAPTNG